MLEWQHRKPFTSPIWGSKKNGPTGDVHWSVDNKTCACLIWHQDNWNLAPPHSFVPVDLALFKVASLHILQPSPSLHESPFPPCEIWQLSKTFIIPWKLLLGCCHNREAYLHRSILSKLDRQSCNWHLCFCFSTQQLGFTKLYIPTTPNFICNWSYAIYCATFDPCGLFSSLWSFFSLHFTWLGDGRHCISNRFPMSFGNFTAHTSPIIPSAHNSLQLFLPPLALFFVVHTFTPRIGNCKK